MNRPLLLCDYLSESAQRLPDKVALVCERGRFTYLALDRAADALAGALARRGVARGDRVVVFGGNSAEVVISFWAVLKANAVAVLVNPLTRADKLAYLLQDSGAAVLIADASRASELARLAPGARAPCGLLVYGEGRGSFEQALQEGEPPPPRRCIDADLAALAYTSGTTGEPKGVMLTHANMLAAATSVSTYLRIAEDEVILCALPLAFTYGLYQMIMAFGAGARLVLERSFAFPVQVMQRVVGEAATGFPGVPSMFATMGDLKGLDQCDFSNIRHVTNAAAALHPKHIDMLRRTFRSARIYSMYGMTECKRVSYLPPEDLAHKPASVGIAIPNTEVWLVDEDGRRLGPHRTGRLVVRGATVMRGYWRKPAETAEKLRPGPLPGELVLYTDDYCRMDEDGYLYFVGRMDDIIKSRGEKVPPKEVEDALLAHPGVKEAAVIGVADERLGQAVKAFVVAASGAQLAERELRMTCHERLESFMVPRDIVVVPELPKGPSGKIQKGRLA
ncbi:MAG TPA: class I adenylate-forming enzyme family protein [Burkholderiales bacterium]